MIAGGRVEKTVDFVEVLQLNCWEVTPGAQKGWGISASWIRDGAFGGEGLVSLNLKWSEQNGVA